MKRQLIAISVITTLMGLSPAARADEGQTGNHRYSNNPEQPVYEEDTTLSLAELQFTSISDEQYRRHFDQRSPRYSERRRRGGVAFLCSGMGLLTVGTTLLAGGLYIIQNSTDPWLLEEMFGGLMVGIGTPATAAGIALTIVGSIRLSRQDRRGNGSIARTDQNHSDRGRRSLSGHRVAFADRLSISPRLSRQEQNLTLGWLF